MTTWLVALLTAALLGYVNLHNDEVQVPLLVLFLSGFLLGCIRPRRVWLWAFIIGLGVPLSTSGTVPDLATAHR